MSGFAIQPTTCTTGTCCFPTRVEAPETPNDLPVVKRTDPPRDDDGGGSFLGGIFSGIAGFFKAIFSFLFGWTGLFDDDTDVSPSPCDRREPVVVKDSEDDLPPAPLTPLSGLAVPQTGGALNRHS